MCYVHQFVSGLVETIIKTTGQHILQIETSMPRTRGSGSSKKSAHYDGNNTINNNGMCSNTSGVGKSTRHYAFPDFKYDNLGAPRMNSVRNTTATVQVIDTTAKTVICKNLLNRNASNRSVTPYKLDSLLLRSARSINLNEIISTTQDHDTIIRLYRITSVEEFDKVLKMHQV